MVLNVISIPTVLAGYTLIILVLVNDTDGSSLTDIGKDNGKLLNAILEQIKRIESTVNTTNKKITDIEKIIFQCNEAEGFFIAPDTGGAQCLKVILEKLDWDTAKAKCAGDAAGLVLARPFNAIALRTYLFERFSTGNFWVNAKGSLKNKIMWGIEAKKNEIISDSPFLNSKSPEHNDISIDCLTLTTDFTHIKEEPDKPYFSVLCGDSIGYALCEKVSKLSQKQNN